MCSIFIRDDPLLDIGCLEIHPEVSHTLWSGQSKRPKGKFSFLRTNALKLLIFLPGIVLGRPNYQRNRVLAWSDEMLPITIDILRINELRKTCTMFLVRKMLTTYCSFEITMFWNNWYCRFISVISNEMYDRHPLIPHLFHMCKLRGSSSTYLTHLYKICPQTTDLVRSWSHCMKSSVSNFWSYSIVGSELDRNRCSLKYSNSS